jgi:hypothetical protein
MTDNPAPPDEAAPIEDAARVSWADAMVVLESEALRCRRWQGYLLQEIAEGKCSAKEVETLQSGIRRHVHCATVFETVMRMVERVRSDRQLLRRLKEIDADERGVAIEGDDQFEYDR